VLTKDEIDELERLHKEAIPAGWKVCPLEGKYYGTEVHLGDGLPTFTVWTGCQGSDYDASVREKERGWDRKEDGFDHVETAKDYATALLMVQVRNLLPRIIAALREKSDG